MIDEIQKAPELLNAIKIKVDHNSSRGQYLITGSSNLHFVKAVSDSLAGRLGRVRLDDAIEYAKYLNDNGRVFDDTAWQTPAKLKHLTGIKATVTVYASDGGSAKLGDNTPYVTDFLIRTCPSYYKRDYMNFLFAEKNNA